MVQFKTSPILFQNKTIQMVIIQKLTKIIGYKKLKLENHFFEMLTATVSHDMRTPLNAIIGLANNLEMYIPQEEGKRYNKIIVNSAKILLFLVNDMLDFFQIRNGKFKLNLMPTNIRNTVTELLDIFYIPAEQKGI